MRKVTVIPKVTPRSIPASQRIGKILARLLRAVCEVGLFDEFFAGGVVGVKGFAGDDVVRVFSAGGTCFVHVFDDCVD
jgi:hypothetical protein